MNWLVFNDCDDEQNIFEFFESEEAAKEFVGKKINQALDETGDYDGKLPPYIHGLVVAQIKYEVQEDFRYGVALRMVK